VRPSPLSAAASSHQDDAENGAVVTSKDLLSAPYTPTRLANAVQTSPEMTGSENSLKIRVVSLCRPPAYNH
jgi:hypothetical protein